MYIPFIILYNTALTDQSSNNHIPLDNEYQALHHMLQHHLHQHTVIL